MKCNSCASVYHDKPETKRVTFVTTSPRVVLRTANNQQLLAGAKRRPITAVIGGGRQPGRVPGATRPWIRTKLEGADGADP